MNSINIFTYLIRRNEMRVNMIRETNIHIFFFLSNQKFCSFCFIIFILPKKLLFEYDMHGFLWGEKKYNGELKGAFNVKTRRGKKVKILYIMKNLRENLRICVIKKFSKCFDCAHNKSLFSSFIRSISITRT